ncbi:MAG: hypothetical protein NTV93_00835 [Verrucomicrobia bacterium]|nr:hypothetical protein [Verrucomicrobiota bacterium]
MAEKLHGTDPAFIPPFPGSVAKYLSAKSAFLLRHGEITGFIATRDGRPVGRIAAIINRSHNERYSDRTGFFGFFECEDNPATAAALFGKVAGVLKASGMDRVRGPYNPSINDECGMLASRFDLPPVIGLTWNPEYYLSLLAGEGFADVRTLHGMNLPMHRLPQPARLARIVDRVASRSHLKMRTMDISRLPEELKIVREVYNATLERNWGFVPISMEDLLGAADDIRAIADPKLLLIAEMDGRDAGVALTLPNFNEILARVKRTPHWLRLPHIFLLMKTHKINSCRQTVLGVVPGCRDRGLHAWLIHEQFVRAQERYANATLGWMEDTNSEILRNCEIVGGEWERIWKIFEKAL